MEDIYIELARIYAKNRGDFNLDGSYDYMIDTFTIKTSENESELFVMVSFERTPNHSGGYSDPEDEGGQYIFNCYGDLLVAFILHEIFIITNYVHNPAIIEKADFILAGGSVN